MSKKQWYTVVVQGGCTDTSEYNGSRIARAIELDCIGDDGNCVVVISRTKQVTHHRDTLEKQKYRNPVYTMLANHIGSTVLDNLAPKGSMIRRCGNWSGFMMEVHGILKGSRLVYVDEIRFPDSDELYM